MSILAKRQLERAKGGATRIGDARRSGVHRTTTSEPERPGICGRWSGVTSFVEPAPRACAIQFRRRPRGAPQAQIEEGNLGNRQNRQAGGEAVEIGRRPQSVGSHPALSVKKVTRARKRPAADGALKAATREWYRRKRRDWSWARERAGESRACSCRPRAYADAPPDQITPPSLSARLSPLLRPALRVRQNRDAGPGRTSRNGGAPFATRS